MRYLRTKLALVACAAALATTTTRAADAEASEADAAAADVAAADAVAAEAAAADGAAAAAGDVAGTAAAAAAAAAQDKAPGADGKMGPDFVADGARVTVKEGDFSVQPPRGWEVYTHLPSLTLLMQIPYQPGMKYQRTIQVASFSDSRFIDEVTAKEYEEVIVRKFSATSVSIDGYKVRNHMPIEMADGRQGLLFYTEFVLDGVNLMQAHILVSSQSRHYLMTFTDLAEHFENDGASQFLTEAWDSMISVQLGSRTPARFETALYLAVGAGVLALLGVLVMLMRRWRSGRQYKDYADGRSYDSTTQAPASLAASGLSGLSSLTSNIQDLASVHSLTEAPRKKVAVKQKPAKAKAPATVADESLPAESLPAQSSVAEEPFETQDDVAI